VQKNFSFKNAIFALFDDFVKKVSVDVRSRCKKWPKIFFGQKINNLYTIQKPLSSLYASVAFLKLQSYFGRKIFEK
jgi:hypothetical protein